MQQAAKERWLAGAADLCELLARAFAYPDGSVAKALSEGSFQSDVRSCAADLEIAGMIASFAEVLDSFVGRNAEELNELMRRGSSRMYFVGGLEVPVFPYEGPFRFRVDDRPGEPSLFSNRSAVDAQKHMHEAGVNIDTNRGEPADAIWFELAFLSHTFAQEFVATQEFGAYSNEARLWANRRNMFADVHGPWMIPFMEQTCEAATDLDPSDVYGPLAQLAAAVLPTLLDSSASANLAAGKAS